MSSPLPLNMGEGPGYESLLAIAPRTRPAATLSLKGRGGSMQHDGPPVALRRGGRAVFVADRRGQGLGAGAAGFLIAGGRGSTSSSNLLGGVQQSGASHAGPDLAGAAGLPWSWSPWS